MHDYLEEFLKVFWLRPETAILNALLAKNLPKNYLSNKKSADLSCGDGIFAFIANNGKINKEFNYYKNTEINSSIVRKEDIYSYYDNSYNPVIEKRADFTYGYGVDINTNMLHKANKLNIYDNLLLYTGEKFLDEKRNYPVTYLDNGQSIELEAGLDLISIFSSIYMFPNVDNLLNKVNYLLETNGTLLVNVKTAEFKHFYDEMEKKYPPILSSYLERDMRNTLNTLLHPLQWEEKFHKNGFVIESKIPTLNSNLVSVWSIGLRFLTPLLVKTTNAIVSEKDLLQIKEEYSATFYEVLKESYNEEITQASSFLYVLKKR